jgi:hypothetical protein
MSDANILVVKDEAQLVSLIAEYLATSVFKLPVESCADARQFGQRHVGSDGVPSAPQTSGKRFVVRKPDRHP